MSDNQVSLNNCPKCDFKAKDGDCASCKLAALAEAKRKADKAKENKSKKRSIDDDDDYSISERLTENEKDHSILFLVIAATATFALVILFTKLLN